MKNTVFIATSLDGFIADKNNKVDWLHETPNPEGIDMGFNAFIATIDALVMGRNTFEMVQGMGGDWPYPKPVFLLSNTLTSVPEQLNDKVFIVNGELDDVVKTIHGKGFQNLYIDGGLTVQSFLRS